MSFITPTRISSACSSVFNKRKTSPLTKKTSAETPSGVSAAQTIFTQTAEKTASTSLKGRLFSRINPIKELFLDAIKSNTNIAKFSELDIYNLCQYATTLAQKESPEESEKKAVLFLFKKLSNLPSTQWNRCRFLKDQIALQRWLSPELNSLLSELEKKPLLQEDEDFQIKIAIAKGELATRLGLEPVSTSAGVNGAQFIKSLEGDIIGVFKASQPTSIFDIIGLIKRWFGQARLLCKAPKAQEYAEEYAHKLSKKLGFHITPAAKMCQLSNKEGVFIAFLGGYKQAKDIKSEFDKKIDFTLQEKMLFQKMALYDFLTGNMDCHDENWFVQLKDKEITEIRVIDHGNSFIESNPSAFGSTGNQYAWGKWKIASRTFTSEFINFVRDLSLSDLNTFIDEARGPFLNEKMETLLRKRFALLKEGILTETIKTPEQLSKIHTDSDFETCLKEISQKMAKNHNLGSTLIVDIKTV